jgi:hypothetical protein
LIVARSASQACIAIRVCRRTDIGASVVPAKEIML